MNQPLVSICMASYNNAHYVLETLNSIAQQTYENLELIIVDDYSTDSSIDIITDWLANTHLPNVFIKNKKNLGVCKVVNLLVRNSSGKYLSTIGSDDLMLPEKISRQVSIMEGANPEVGVVYSDAFLIGSEGEEFFGKFIQWHRHFFEIPQGNIFCTLIEGNFIPVMSLLWKRECFEICGEFDESLIYEDYDMLLRISLKFKFVFSDYISVKYRLHNTNLHKSLQGIAGIESSFAVFFKHISVEGGKFDAIIKKQLLAYLIRMYDLKSNRINFFYQQYRLHFDDDISLRVALLSGLSYYHLARIQRFFNKIAKAGS